VSATDPLDLLVIGAGPTGIAIGVEARRAGFGTLVVDAGSLVASLVDYPAEMLFFTTRDRLEIAGVPFAIPEEKPNRRQAIAYYQGVAAASGLPLALHETVVAVRPEVDGFVVESRRGEEAIERRARAVAVATGYFRWPRRLGVPGEDQPWVHARYREPWPHFGQRVAIVGGGNSAAEVALDLWRHGAEVTMIVRAPALKPTVKYWVKPDLEHRIEEGSIRALFGAQVTAFERGLIRLESAAGAATLPADAAYVLIGYRPDPSILVRAGVEVDPVSLVPAFDAATCESNVPGLYVAGTIQAGAETHRIFIENSRHHAPKIVRHLASRRSPRARPAG